MSTYPVAPLARLTAALLVFAAACHGCSSNADPDAAPGAFASSAGKQANSGGGGDTSMPMPGAVRWQTSIADAEIAQIAGLPDGGVVVASVAASPRGGSAQLALRVLDSDGSERWAQSIEAGQPRQPETGPAMAVDAQGRIYLLLGRQDEVARVAIGDQALSCPGPSCLGLASFDAGGALRWLVPIDVTLAWHWMTSTEDGVVLGLAFDSQPILLAVGADGGQRWQVPWPLDPPAPYLLGPITAGAGSFLAGDRAGGLYVVGSYQTCAAVTRLSSADGSMIWQQQACGGGSMLSDAIVMDDGALLARAHSRDEGLWPLLAFGPDGRLAASLELPLPLRPIAPDGDTALLAPITLGPIAGIGQGGDARFQWPGTLEEGAIGPHPSGLGRADVAPAPDGDLYILTTACASARALLGAPALHEVWTDVFDSAPYHHWLLARVRVPGDYQPRCGNGLLDPSEACDGDDFDNPDIPLDGNPRLSQCSEWLSGAGNTGAPACTPECEVDLSVCESSCGNGMLDENEGCDGDLFRGVQSCDQAMLGSGPLGCRQCVTDLSVCPMRASCGNGTREEWEACDGMLIDPERGPPSCQEIGLSGTITCLECLEIDLTSCTEP